MKKKKIGNERIVEQLIAKGADVNAMDASGRAPLYWAVMKQYENVTQTLIENGANLNIKHNAGVPSFHTAIKHGNKL